MIEAVPAILVLFSGGIFVAHAVDTYGAIAAVAKEKICCR